MTAVASFERNVVINAPSTKTLNSRRRPLPPAAPAVSAAVQSKNPAMSATAAVSMSPRKKRKRFHSVPIASSAEPTLTAPVTTISVAPAPADQASLIFHGRRTIAISVAAKMIAASALDIFFA
jgi:hypothetical protein